VTNSVSSDTVVVDIKDRILRNVTVRDTNWYRIAYSYHTDGTLASKAATSNRWVGTKTQSWGYNPTNAVQTFTTWAGATTLNPGTGNEDLATTISYPSALGLTRTFSSLHTNFNVAYNVSDVNNRLGAQVTLDANGRIIERAKPANDSARSYMYAYGRISQQNRYRVNSRTGCTQNPDYGYQCTNDYAFIAPADQFTYDDVGTLMNGVTQLDVGNRVRAATIGGQSYWFDYDADGNLSRKHGTAWSEQTLTWNALGQLFSVVGGGPSTWQFTYDGLGRRASKTVNGVTKRYLYEGDNLFMELDNSGAPVVEYAYWGLDNPHSMLKGGQTYYFVRDPVGGSVKGLVRHSDNSVQAQYGYTMFGYPDGTTIDNVGNTLQFAGREFDETGLYYNRARYYDPLIGRFISEDPIGLEGGVNLYAYAGNDPANSRDPMGMWQECDYVRGGAVTMGGTTNPTTGAVSGASTTTYEPGYWTCSGRNAWDYPGEGIMNRNRLRPRRGSANRQAALMACRAASIDLLVNGSLDALTLGAARVPVALARAGLARSLKGFNAARLGSGPVPAIAADVLSARFRYGASVGLTSMAAGGNAADVAMGVLDLHASNRVGSGASSWQIAYDISQLIPIVGTIASAANTIYSCGVAASAAS
jgi:RHS repeat-associated protein